MGGEIINIKDFLLVEVVKPVDFSEFMKGSKELGVFWAAVNEPTPAAWREATGVQNARGALSKEMRSANEIPAPYSAPGG